MIDPWQSTLKADDCIRSILSTTILYILHIYDSHFETRHRHGRLTGLRDGGGGVVEELGAADEAAGRQPSG